MVYNIAPSIQGHVPVHNKHSMRKYGLIYLDSFDSESEILHRLDTYFKFLVVRHPLDRLLSGYYEKLVKNNKYYKQGLGKYIVELVRKEPTHRALTEADEFTFTELLMMLLIFHQNWKKVDGHWENYFKLCLPCAIKYDYIAKLETSDFDAQHIIQHKLSKKFMGMNRKLNVFRNQSDYVEYGKVLAEYDSVPNDLLCEVLKYYRDDMEMFGYTAVRDVLSGRVYAKCSTGNTGCC